MLRIRSDALDFIDRWEHTDKFETLVGDFARFCDEQGFNTFIVSGRTLPTMEAESSVIATGWPESWTRRYREQNYLKDDPVVHRALVSDRPFFWADTFQGLTPRGKALLKDSEDAGFRDGVVVPIHGADSSKSIVSLATPFRVDISRSELAMIQAVALSFHGRARDMKNEPKDTCRKLSPREREVLLWCTAGKTSWEIGHILSVSEGTVELHRKSAIRKLNASNITQAVVIAIRNGEIRP